MERVKAGAGEFVQAFERHHKTLWLFNLDQDPVSMRLGIGRAESRLCGVTIPMRVGVSA
jgi:hypothetical protein